MNRSIRTQAAFACLLLSSPALLTAGPLERVARHTTRAWGFERQNGIRPEDGMRSPRKPGSFAALDAAYEALPAAEKLRELFEVRIRGTEYPAGDYPSLLKGLLPAAKTLLPHLLKSSLTRVADEFPKPKLKYIHTFGSTAKVELVPAEGSPYTGLFRGGAGLLRFSQAGPPILGIGNVPGLGLKLLVDGRPSENLVAMYGLNSQGPGTSVFQREFSNILPAPKGIIMNSIRLAFEAVVGKGNGFVQPVDGMAAVDRHGNDVADPKAPYRIVFEPTGDYPYTTETRNDFREDLDTLPEGTVLYRIWGIDEPGGPRVAMGTLVSRSEFVASSYGDLMLFFKHNATFLKR